MELLKQRDANDFNASAASGQMIRVEGPWKGTHAPRAVRLFSAAISCVGPGPEKIFEDKTDVEANVPRWNGYTGPDFWRHNDGMDYQNQTPEISNVVISGGGDGAMQDFQRVATATFGLRLLDEIIKGADVLTQKDLLPAGGILPGPALLRQVLSADDAGRRACFWLQGKMLSLALSDWNAAFSTEIDKSVNGWDLEAVRTLAHHLFRKEVCGGRLKITWVVKDPTLGAGYGLNRYLSLLLLALARRTFPEDYVFFSPGSEIATIAPHPDHRHTCGRFEVCGGKPHNVKIVRAKGPDLNRTAGLVIVRHGLDKMDTQDQLNRLLGGLPLIRNQIVPFDLPPIAPDPATLYRPGTAGGTLLI